MTQGPQMSFFGHTQKIKNLNYVIFHVKMLISLLVGLLYTSESRAYEVISLFITLFL